MTTSMINSITAIKREWHHVITNLVTIGAQCVAFAFVVGRCCGFFPMTNFGMIGPETEKKGGFYFSLQEIVS